LSGNFYYNKNEFPGLDLTGGSLPDVFFKLGEGGQIEVYDDENGGDNGDAEDDEYEEFEQAQNNNNNNNSENANFSDAENETEKK
jgi:hypothetical protein